MRSVARALDVFLPPSCGACGLPGDPVCDGCRCALATLPPPWCGGCGHPVPIPARRCPACVGPLAGARQAVAYDGPVPALFAALKDRGRRDVADPLAAVVAARVPRPPAGSWLVPVPIGRRRLAERGFNQAALLAGSLARQWSLPVADVLVRAREDGSQRGSARSERARRAAGAFAIAMGATAPRKPVLVDDVHTTGATLGACARVLARAGAEGAAAVCVARAIDRKIPPGEGGSESVRR